jgi:uncharacterized damage-inducible protein DinB
MSYQNVMCTLVGYHVASNRRLWDHLLEHLTDEQFTQPLGYSHGSIRNQVVHLAATDHYWLHDIQSKPVTGLDPMDYPTRASFAATWGNIEAALLEYVQLLAEDDLQEVPDGLMETRWEALVHIVNHGTDHRAQILSMLHGLGAPTFEQDFPGYLRSRRWVSRADVLRLIGFWHAKWEQALASTSPERLEQPAAGEWSVKDILAHLTWYEGEMVRTLQERKYYGAGLWELPRDERNRHIYEQQRSHPLEQVLAQHRQVHAALIEQVERLNDEDLNDPSRIQGMPPGSKLWELLERNTWFHYLLHAETLWAWLGSS